jgi:uncharacterized membrane protein YdjX (TVP38/TMEM64 family)
VTACVLLAVILVPFFLFEEPVAGWTNRLLSSSDAVLLMMPVLALLLAADIFLPVPSSLVSTAAGSLFGFWAGTAVSWVGLTFGCVIGYAASARFGSDWTERCLGEEKMERVRSGTARWGMWNVALMRGVPVMAEASVLFAGLVRMPWQRFLLSAAFSNLALSAAYAAVGSSIIPRKYFGAVFAAAIISAAMMAPAAARASRQAAALRHRDAP